MDDRQLQQFLAALIGRPIVWGVSDCLCAAGDASALITGRDPIAPVRGLWRNAAEAKVFEDSLGGTRRAAARALGDRLGLAEIDPAAARPGDLALTAVYGRQVTACRLTAGWFVRAQRGFLIRQSAAVMAWRV